MNACPICHGPFLTGEHCVVLPPGNGPQLHSACIVRWLDQLRPSVGSGESISEQVDRINADAPSPRGLEQRALDLLERSWRAHEEDDPTAADLLAGHARTFAVLASRPREVDIDMVLDGRAIHEALNRYRRESGR